MKNILIALFALISLFSFGQADETSFKSEIKQFDISDLWTIKILETRNDTFVIERPEPLGYIGNNFQRFYIHFLSVIKNPDNGFEYFVYGKSKVKSNICSFQGLITITESKTFDDSDFPNIKQGFIKGEYQFFENPNQKGTGIFKGHFQTDFYVSPNKLIKYNNLRQDDSFHNNFFEGCWTKYNSKDSIKCNWGDYRIPDSNKLDCGVSEFEPCEAFVKFDWLRYKIAYGASTDRMKVNEAKKGEKEKWWIDQE